MLQANNYMNLIHRVINDLHIPFYVRDEAFSEGLVGLACAIKSFKPQKGAKATTWIYSNIRWTLLNWMAREIRYESHRCELVEETVTPTVPDFLSVPELEETVQKSNVLSAKERTALFGKACGMQLPELCALLRLSGPSVVSLQATARSTLAEHTDVAC